MKITKSQLKQIIKEELRASLTEGFMDLFRSKGPVDSALREIEEYLQDTSNSAYETAKAILSQNIKRQTMSSSVVRRDFDRRNIESMKNRVQPIQIKYSIGDQTGQEVKNLIVSLLPGRRGTKDLRLSYSFDFIFGVTQTENDKFSIKFGVAAPPIAGSQVLLPHDLGSQVGELIADKIGQMETYTVSTKQLLPLLMTRARFIIDILPALYRFVIADTYIDYRYDYEQSAEDVFDKVLKPAYEEIQATTVRGK